MIEQYLRPNYQQFLVEPVAKQLNKRISANTITVLSGLVGLAIMPALYYHNIGVALFLLVLSGYLDTLDGTLARLSHHTTPFGSALDISSDRLVESSIIIGLYLLDPTHRGLACLIMLASVLLCVTSFLVVGVFTENQSQKGFHYSSGLIERFEAFIFFALMLLFSSYFLMSAYLFSTLVLLTAFIRLKQFYIGICSSLLDL